VAAEPEADKPARVAKVPASALGPAGAKPLAATSAKPEPGTAANGAADANAATNPYRAIEGEAGTPVTAAKPTSPGAARSIDDLLDQAAPGGDDLDKALASSAQPSGPSHGAQGLPQTPSRDQVVAAMRAIEPDVRACTQGQPLDAHTASAEITVTGATGRVNFVRVGGVQGAVNSCIARAVRNAMFPQFTRGQLRINFPFRLTP
jgi:hypothetical protein